VTNTCNISN